MSADNWAVCPRCENRRAKKIAAKDAEIVAAYGRVSVGQFDEMRDERDALAEAEPERTFREDYEFYGANEGVLSISYSGRCTACGLSHTFKHEETMQGVDQ